MPSIQGILETCLYAEDLDGMERFYRDVLGLPLVGSDPHRHRFFRCGKQMLLVFNPKATCAAGGMLPPHGTRGAGHVAFEVQDDDELEAWRGRLADCQIPIEAEVDWSGRGRSFYLRDPAGNSVEFAQRRMWPVG